MPFEYATLTQLGKEYGVSAKTVGDWLIKIGLRTARRDPSDLAKSEGFAKLFEFDDANSFYVWHRSKTIAALSEAGYFLPGTPDEIDEKPSPESAGPYEITDPLGKVVAQADDPTIARFLNRVIKLASDNGRWPPKAEV